MPKPSPRDGNPFRVALTGDFVAPDGTLYFDAGAMTKLRSLPNATVDVLDSGVGAPLSADVLRSYDAVITKRSPIMSEALAQDGIRTIHISRNGVGFEHLDLEACTRAGVMVTTTPPSVRRPIASSAVTFILALAHRLFEKDRATRAGCWHDRFRYQGIGLADRVLGVVGAGNIGTEVLTLTRPWNMVRLVASPSLAPEAAARLDAEKVELDVLLARADFVVLCCPLNDRTRHLVNERSLALMRPGSFIINVARGGLIDEAALIRALEEEWIAGAALDVFDPEPPEPDNPLLGMANTIVTSHNIGFSDESNRLGNTYAAEAVMAVASDRLPEFIVNPGVVDHARLGHLRSSKE